ncbi:putative T7SS-secreted protein [Streptomyces sp. NPDC048462]|uniref:putative T7SS-secreted protein n=1 Tax=Streptomyces sp. NPDC048462 TaxID=3365555 RepID=UPI0037226C84
MGIGDIVSDLTPDVVEDAVEDGTKWVGDRVEDVGNWTADRLDDVGWESGADWVREQSRSVANRMGAEVDEMDLGQTEDKTKLIYGSPSGLRSSAAHLKALQGAFDKVGGGLKGLDASTLKGKTADAFRDSVSIEPPKWFKAADAFEKAAGALESFAGTVQWAQGQAQLAIDQWKAGTKASEEAMDAHKDRCDTYNKAVDTYNALPSDKRDPATLPPKPGEFKDPGKARMEEAQQLLTEARKQRNTAGETARTLVTAARDTAPKNPTYAEQAVSGVSEFNLAGTHFVGGIAKGTAGMLNFVRSVNPMDAYNLTHPAEYALSLNNTAAGLVQVANDPSGAGKQMVTEFMKDPAEGLGRLVPDLVLTAATGGGGAAVKGARTAKELADLAQDANKARRLVDDAPEGTHNRTPEERTTKNTDPVDLASGRMFLPQTDIVLPGTLPLTFTRRVESGYTAGRFFGPSWSSTVDEHLEIDANGVIHITDDGRLITYPHPAPGLSTCPETGTSRSGLDRAASGDYTLTDPDTGLTRHFDAPTGSEPGGDGDAWLSEISDRNDNTITFDRAENGTPLAVVHSAGYHLELTSTDEVVTGLALLTPTIGEEALTADGRSVAHPLRAYGYTDGNLTEVTKPSGATLTLEYDHRHRVVAWIDSNNCRYEYKYDDHDRCVAEGGEAGHMQLTLAYGAPEPDTGLRTTTLRTAAGHTTHHLIGEGCRVLATTDPLGHTTRFTYDTRGNPLTRTDPLGRTTAFGYDEKDRLATVIRPDGTELHAVRNPLGHLTEFTGPDGGRRQQEFDERGNRIAASDAAGLTTRFAYDAHGRLVSVTDALGAVTTVKSDPAGLPLEVTDPRGGKTRYERDALGRPVRVTDPLGAVTQLEWTTDGELACRRGPDGGTESWTYDGEGSRTSHTDPVGQVTHFEYTHFELSAARTGPDGARYEFDHDTELRLTQVTNCQGLKWSYTYDAAGRLSSETDFDGRTLTYTRDAAGQVTVRTNALGETLAYERDPLGRVIAKDVAGAVTTYAYDRAGRMVRAAGPDSELIYQYDRRGQVKTELADGRATTYTYDALGRRAQRTTPTGRITTYGYDTAGRPTHLTADGHRIAFIHDMAGREIERDFSGALTLTSGWDAAGRLSTQRLSTGDRTLNNCVYTYRADGHVTALDDTLRGFQRFDLDAAGRVTEVTAAAWTESYAYDMAGNQTSATWPEHRSGSEARGHRVHTGTRLRRAGANSYTYDTAGRLVLRNKSRPSKKAESWRYSYNADDQLTALTTPDGTQWRYRYDPLGRRTSKERMAADGTSVAERTAFTWDGTVLAEQTTSHPDRLPYQVTLTWNHQGLTPLAQTERLTEETTQREIDSRFFAIATDLIGTPTALISESGDIAWHTRTTLWGNTTWNADATTYTPLRFPGQYYDPESGLHYNHHRYYDPQTARYTTPDPLGLAPAPNPVTYVHNPLTWADPLGLTPYPPKGEHSNPFGHRADAERAAFEAAGVPYGETPIAEWTVTGDKSLKHVPGYAYSSDASHWGNFRQFETDQGSRVVVEHTHDPAGQHFHAGKPKIDDSRELVNFGWDNGRVQRGDGSFGYPEDMERYGKINKPGGDHHFFYEGN